MVAESIRKETDMIRRAWQQASVAERAGLTSIASTSRAIHTAPRKATPSVSPLSRQQLQKKQKDLKEKQILSLKIKESTKPDPILGHQANEQGDAYWKSSELYKVILSKDEVWGVREDRRGNLIAIEDDTVQDGKKNSRVGPQRMNFGLDGEEDRQLLFSDLPLIMEEDLTKHIEDPNMVSNRLLSDIQEMQVKGPMSVDVLSRVLDLRNASGKGIQVENIRRIINHFGARAEGDSRGPDTGSVEAQAAVLTYRIRNLHEHLEDNRHDNHNRRSMNLLVHQRARLLKYLKRKSPSRYEALLPRIGVTARAVEGEVILPGKPRMKIAS